MTSAIVPVIMCGGAGTRLWPASRESLPKQFIPFLDERSTFQEAVLRLADPGLFLRPVVVTHRDARFVVAEQLAALGVAADVLLEPERRDSAAAVAVAAVHAAGRHPEALVLVAAADHAVPDARAFRDACRAAVPGARDGLIMTLGLVPDRPATAYGYIRPGEALAGGARRVERFVEKPDAETAAAYLSEGYLWNSGCFLFRADVMLSELERHEPAVLAAARQAVDRAAVDLDFVRLDEEAFRRAPRISLDYAVMERTDRAGVLPVSFAWSDVGTWGALLDVLPRDPEGNALMGPVEALDTRDSLVISGDVLTAVVGLEGAVVVVEPDAVLVTTRARSGDVKELVSAMRARGRPEASEHLRLYRPWGWYQRIDLGDRFRVKRICVKPGGRLSLQKHFHRAEHWVVVRGTAEVTVDGEARLLHENEAAYVPIGAVHRLANPGRIPLEIIEVQVGPYTGEDDIVRLDDVYGRE